MVVVLDIVGGSTGGGATGARSPHSGGGGRRLWVLPVTAVVSVLGPRHLAAGVTHPPLAGPVVEAESPGGFCDRSRSASCSATSLRPRSRTRLSDPIRGPGCCARRGSWSAASRGRCTSCRACCSATSFSWRACVQDSPAGGAPVGVCVVRCGSAGPRVPAAGWRRGWRLRLPPPRRPPAWRPRLGGRH